MLRHSASCERTEADLRSCYRALVTWRNALESWLGHNRVVGSRALSLPSLPSWQGGTLLERNLTRTLASLFRLTVESRARAETRRRVSVSFDAPLARAAALRLAVALGASRDIDVVGTFIGADSVVTAGRAGHDAVTGVRSGTALERQFDGLYRDQLQSTAAVRHDLMVDGADEGGRRGIARAVADLTRYRRVLENRAPFVSGFTADVDVPELLAAVATTSRVTSVIIPGSSSATFVPTLRATIREFSDVQPKVVAAKAQAASAPQAASAASAYMPNTWLARTFATGPANRYGLHRKQTNLIFRWKDASRLAYYQGAAAGKRGFEAQAVPYTGKPWASIWGPSWGSNMPSAYQDDLTEDHRYSVFAIGSANGRALTANKVYWANYQTFPLAIGNADEGRAQLSGQAVHRASSPGERFYCGARGGSDKYCFFGTATSIVGTYPLGSKFHVFP
jgi:hypothetical protein